MARGCKGIGESKMMFAGGRKKKRLFYISIGGVAAASSVFCECLTINLSVECVFFWYLVKLPYFVFLHVYTGHCEVL